MLPITPQGIVAAEAGFEPTPSGSEPDHLPLVRLRSELESLDSNQAYRVSKTRVLPLHHSPASYVLYHISMTGRHPPAPIQGDDSISPSQPTSPWAQEERCCPPTARSTPGPSQDFGQPSGSSTFLSLEWSLLSNAFNICCLLRCPM